MFLFQLKFSFTASRRNRTRENRDALKNQLFFPSLVSIYSVIIFLIYLHFYPTVICQDTDITGRCW